MLSIVSTPIGNLKDITLRAIETLKECDAIVCEDTRVTGKLLQCLEIEKKELISFHSYSNEQKLDQIMRRLAQGEHFALVSDSGTPCISDPGYKIISGLKTLDMRYQVIPGPSAFLAALSVSGLPMNKFIYLGFLPIKKGRKKLLESLRKEERTIVFYESVHRIQKTMKELYHALKDEPDRPMVICRELTKLYEEVIRITVKDLPHTSFTKKGEFVIVIGHQ